MYFLSIHLRLIDWLIDCLQASRGAQFDDGIDVSSSSEDKNVQIPLEADQLVVHSTSEGITLCNVPLFVGVYTNYSTRKLIDILQTFTVKYCFHIFSQSVSICLACESKTDR